MSQTLFKKLLLLALLPVIAACASTPSDQQTKTKSDRDPYEGFNRAIFSFNDGIDRILLKPAAKGYQYVAPEFVETGVSNFFSNLGEVSNLVNSGLQGKGKKTLNHTGRLLVNSTLGVLGFIDVAKYMGLEKTTGEDFGQTLATWGVGSGPYLVLPLLGPSTLRSTVSIPADNYTNPVSHVDHDRTRNSLTATNIIDNRAQLLSVEDLISGDRYIFVRDFYLQRREFLINDGKVEDSFSESLDDRDF